MSAIPPKRSRAKKAPEPKQAALPLPLKQWFVNTGNPLRLRELLEDTTFQTAVLTARDLGLPTGASVSTKDQHQLAVSHAYLAGFCDFLTVLRSLTVLPVDPLNEDGWSYVTPEQNSI